MHNYRAPWGWPLILVSAISTVILVGVSTSVLIALNRPFDLLFALAPFAVVLGTLPFTVRGYSLESGTLYVQRLLWRTEVSLEGLRAVEAMPNAMRGSLRSFGNGGLFSITGYYWSKALGKYRAWVTDLPRTVVLRFDGRAVVVSPEDPEQFVADLRKTKRLGG